MPCFPDCPHRLPRQRCRRRYCTTEYKKPPAGGRERGGLMLCFESPEPGRGGGGGEKKLGRCVVAERESRRRRRAGIREGLGLMPGGRGFCLAWSRWPPAAADTSEDESRLQMSMGGFLWFPASPPPSAARAVLPAAGCACPSLKPRPAGLHPVAWRQGGRAATEPNWRGGDGERFQSPPPPIVFVHVSSFTWSSTGVFGVRQKWSPS